MGRRLTDPKRPWSRVTELDRFEKKYIPEPNSGCWLWTGGLNDSGYGVFLMRGKQIRAHRFAFRYFNDPLHPAMEIDHLCRVRCCVNPDHLEQVIHKVNMERSGPATATHCVNGHPWNEENTWRKPSTGGRGCRSCNRERSRARNQRS